MRYRNAFLVLLTALGTIAAWWPLSIQPNLALPFWVLLACTAGCAGLSILLAPSIWPLLLLISGLGTFFGFCLSLLIWPLRGPIIGPGIFYIVGGSVIVVLYVAFSAGVIMRERSISNAILRHAIWAVLLACVAFGPVALAVTPSLVQRRMVRNEQLATQRFLSLKTAVETARAEPDGASRICDGAVLERNYGGPPFSETDWQRITGNYVKQDSYFFMVHCRENAGRGYIIDAVPARSVGDGMRRFCTDESGKVGCRMEWVGSGHKCLPCPQ
jgi:hypothetical protein